MMAVNAMPADPLPTTCGPERVAMTEPVSAGTSSLILGWITCTNTSFSRPEERSALL